MKCFSSLSRAVRRWCLVGGVALAAMTPVLAQQILPPSVDAKSWLIYDVTSGQLLAAQDPDSRVDPASLTKLMTAYLTFEAVKSGALNTTDVVEVSEKAWKAEGSRMFIEPYLPVSVDQLMHGMIVQSGNDASIALAERIAGNEDAFVKMMNQRAEQFGMTNTRFSNATGLPTANHFSTARDLATLSLRLINDFPQFLPFYSIREYTYNNVKQLNRNRLLRTDPSVDGLKTGYTDSAGYCLIATAKRPLPYPIKSPRRVLTVLLGAKSDVGRANQSQTLLNYAYKNFDVARMFEAKTAVQTIPVFKGKQDEVPAGFDRDWFITVPRGQIDQVKAVVERNERLIAPIKAGQVIGTVRLTFNGKPFQQQPLLALNDIPEANVFSRAIDTVRLWFQ